MIRHGDSMELLKEFPENYFDSVVTDPPYGLKFMGKKWDYDVPSVALWKEVLRVLKPGGHLLSFGGTRTYHRMVANIEDAGFEIRDQLQWLYGQGFPKSLNISKAIDKAAGVEREVIGQNPNHRGESQMRNPYTKSLGQDGSITAAATDHAKQWNGWGTALKPANEPIVLARKPISETNIQANVLKWGTGGLNIDGCRVATTNNLNGGAYSKDRTPRAMSPDGKGARETVVTDGFVQPQGRFPANVLFDEESAVMLDEQSGTLKSGAWDGKRKKPKTKNLFSSFEITDESPTVSSQGGASRFFYVAKTSTRERGEGNNHPTVKPIKLMEYLCKLITPETGIVLDPFCGSGTTGIAAARLGFGFVGIERELEFFNVATLRFEKELKGAS